MAADKRKRKPMTQQAIADAWTEMQDASIKQSIAYFLLVLKDKFDATNDDIRRYWDNINELSTNVGNGTLEIMDLQKQLFAECGVMLRPVRPRMPAGRAVRYSDVIAAKKAGRENTINLTELLMLYSMHFKEGWVPNEIKRLLAEMDAQADSIRKGYINTADLVQTLEEEYGLLV